MPRSRRHRQPHSQVETPAVVYTTAQRSTNEQAIRQPSLPQRCLVTGVEVGLLDLQYKVKIGRDARPIPLSIESSQPFPSDGARHTRDYNGAHDWTPAMKRYMRGVTTYQAGLAMLYWREWWRIQSIVEGVRAHPRIGADRMNAVLALLTTNEDGRSIATRFRHTVSWLAESKRRIVRLVRERYLPHYLLRNLREMSEIVAGVTAA